jgi:phage gp46-like protein
LLVNFTWNEKKSKQILNSIAMQNNKFMESVVISIIHFEIKFKNNMGWWMDREIEKQLCDKLNTVQW